MPRNERAETFPGHAVSNRLLDGVALLLAMTCLVPALYLGLVVVYSMTVSFSGVDGEGWRDRFWNPGSVLSPDRMSFWMTATTLIAIPGVVGLLAARRGRRLARVSVAGTATRFASCGLIIDGLLFITVLAMLFIQDVASLGGVAALAATVAGIGFGARSILAKQSRS